MEFGKSNFEKLKPGEKRGALFSDAHMYEFQDPLHESLKGKHGWRRCADSIRKKSATSAGRSGKNRNIDFVFCGGDMNTGYGERGHWWLQSTFPNSSRYWTNISKCLKGIWQEDTKLVCLPSH